MSNAYLAGPLRVQVETANPNLREKIAECLALYDRAWSGPFFDIVLEARAVSAPAPMVKGGYLRCARMSVDGPLDALVATTRCGARMRSKTARPSRWSIEFPAPIETADDLEELEDLVGLALTSGWRAAGWIPVHAAAVARADHCAIFCASSGGGKSTLSAAFVRRGWRALGDDKLLLRDDGNICELSSLQSTFNLHPRTSRWFPEIGDLNRLPRYSTYTEKRKLKIERAWPQRVAPRATPTHLVQVQRDPNTSGIAIRELPRWEVFATLLKQIAIPSDRAAAAPILATAGRTSARLRGLDIVVGEDAYGEPECIETLERELFR